MVTAAEFGDSATGMRMGTVAAVVRRRKMTIFAVAGFCAIAAFVLALALPPVYESSATILIEQQEIPQDLVRSTVTTYVDQQLQVIEQRVMTSANLLEVVTKYNLYAKAREREPLESVLERMANDIEIETVNADVIDPRSGKPTKATIAFNVSFRSEMPQLAQQVANELTSLFLNENLKRRTELTEETFNFLADESAKLEQRVAELESQLADFKERNAGMLPELMEVNLQLLDRTEREISEVDLQLRALEERRIYVQAELSRLGPARGLARLVMRTNDRLVDPGDQLGVLQSEYARAAAVYAPDHPDLVRLRKEIRAFQGLVSDEAGAEEMVAELVDRQTELASLKQRYSAEHPDVKRLQKTVDSLQAAVDRRAVTTPGASEESNPARVQLAAQLAAISAEAQSLRTKRQQLVSKVAGYEQRLTKSPQVEREYLALVRNHGNALREFEELKAKEVEAQLAQSLEIGRKGERFTLIEPPRLPETPVRPNRKALLALGLVLAIGAGFGMAAAAEAFDTTVRDRADLRRLTQVPVLGTIPPIVTTADKLLRRGRGLVVALLVFASVAGALAVLHYNWIPLETLWYITLRRLGVDLV